VVGGIDVGTVRTSELNILVFASPKSRLLAPSVDRLQPKQRYNPVVYVQPKSEDLIASRETGQQRMHLCDRNQLHEQRDLLVGTEQGRPPIPYIS
jgi:hypothetical protein